MEIEAAEDCWLATRRRGLEVVALQQSGGGFKGRITFAGKKETQSSVFYQDKVLRYKADCESALRWCWLGNAGSRYRCVSIFCIKCATICKLLRVKDAWGDPHSPALPLRLSVNEMTQKVQYIQVETRCRYWELLLSGKSFFYLTTQGRLNFPGHSSEEIRCRGELDSKARTQVGWQVKGAVSCRAPSMERRGLAKSV